MNSIADLRKDYSRHGLSEEDVLANPVAQFEKWFQEALDAELPEPNAMHLATVSAEGKPTGRIVLLKGIDTGFCFYTNYESRKGRELLENPYASITFFWAELERQVRIEGRAEKVEESLSDAYFDSRPAGSRLGAWVSDQSQLVANRQALEQKQTDLEQEFANKVIVRPAHWGGYRLIPNRIEFWQGRPSRLHDRLCFVLKADGNWEMTRLQP